MKAMKWFVALIVLNIIFWISLFLAIFVNGLLGLIIGVVLTFLFFSNAIDFVPKDPPQKAVLSFFGKRQPVVINEGICFLPIRPFVFDMVLIKVVKVNFDLEPQNVRTPDRALISVKASMIFLPGIEGDPESYRSYLNSGGEEGVKKILHDIVEDRVKTWASSNKEGPSSWTEAQALKDDVHEVLAKSLLGEALETIPSPIPTNTWMRFFDYPQSEPSVYDVKSGWADKNEATGQYNWSKLQAIYDNLHSDDQAILKAAINTRRGEIRKIREGKGEFGDTSLGIKIVRFSVNEVVVAGKVAEAADLEEKEKKEMEADKVEIANVIARARAILGLKDDENIKISPEEAFKIIQVERGKATRTVINIDGAATGLGQDLIGLGAIVKGLTGGGGKGGEKEKSEDLTKSPEEIKKAWEEYKKKRLEKK